ncbi:MAG TPA: alkaline phosphatase family protein [Candidatus Acidoferrales bacterium]|nr:alkaline phosphatase family protein [Candidatus Acidoferrales bacterium]
MKKLYIVKPGVIIIACMLLISLFLLFANNKPTINLQKVYAASPIQHVFIIAEENHNWAAIKGSSSAPYINKTLLPMGAHAEQYYNPPGNHPSAPNYVWLEAGAAVAGQSDCSPDSANCRSSAKHLTDLLDAAGITWKEYAEDTNGKSCILNFSGADVNHVPFSYFNDVTNNGNANSSNCISHERPYSELAAALQNNTVPRYTFITPNVNDDMHNGTIQQADTWLSQQVPKILNSQAYKTNGVLFIIWDEGEGGDGPIGMIVLSPLAKKNYSNSIHYDHSSTLKTIEEIFGVTPLLGGAAKATDLSDLFTVNIANSGGSKPPAPSAVTPTLYCLGGTCGASPGPSQAAGGGGSGNNQTSPGVSGSPSSSPSQTPCASTNQTNAVHTNSVHELKEHEHKNGGVSNLMLLLLQFIISLINLLLGNNGSIPPINLNPGTTPCPSLNPLPSSVVSPSPSIIPSNIIPSGS